MKRVIPQLLKRIRVESMYCKEIHVLELQSKAQNKVLFLSPFFCYCSEPPLSHHL